MTHLPFFSVLNAVALWFGAVAWHLFYMLQGRPKYELLSDSFRTVGSFMAVSAAGTLLRVYQEKPDASLLSIALGLGGYWLFFFAISSRTKRSDSLFSALIGLGAAIDFIQGTIFLLFGDALPAYLVLSFELLIMILCWRHFLRMPAEVQASGYRRHS